MNELGLRLLESFEGFKPYAYFDCCSQRMATECNCPNRGTLTIAFGDTWHVYHATDSCTREQGEGWLKECLSNLVSHLDALVSVQLNSDQKSALLDFLYNEGYGSLKGSTLLWKLNHGDLALEEEFERWDKTGGEISKGLLERRKAEWALFSGQEQKLLDILNSRGSV